MKNKSLFVFCLALLTIFTMVSTADAVQVFSDNSRDSSPSVEVFTEGPAPELEEASTESTSSQISYQVPSDVLESSTFDVSPDPFGPSVLISVHNTDDEPLAIDVRLLNTLAVPIQHWFFELNPYEIKSMNLRDWIDVINYPVNPDGTVGTLEAMIEVLADRAVAAGDIITVNTDALFAEGELLKSRGAKCTDRCEKYYLRYLQGGLFNGGTVANIRHKGNFGEHPRIDFQLFNEAGTFTEGFSINDAPAGTTVKMSDYTPSAPFGGMYIKVPGTGEPVITGRYLGFGNFSLAWRAVCIPICDPTDPNGRCYTGPLCVRPNLTIVQGGDTTVHVGIPFHAVLRATGTGLGQITCADPLPPGIFFDQNTNTLDGTAQNVSVPSISCSVSGRCGNKTLTIPVNGAPETYGVGIAVDPRDKDCLQPGQTTAQAHVDFHIRNTGNVPETINLTTSIPGCDFTNIQINGQGNAERSCVGDFPLGTTTVTATATIVGRPENATSTGQIIIINCPQACDGVQPPTFTFNILSENNSTATTRSILSYSGAGVSGTVNFTPPPSGGFTGGNATSGANNDSVFPKTASDYTATANWQVIKGGEICFSGSENVIIEDSVGCEDYTIPAPIFGTPNTPLSPTAMMVNDIPVTNGVVCSWNPSLPSGPHPRPPFGQTVPPLSFHCDGTFTPPSTTLSCSTQGDVSVPIPPQEASCPAQPINVPLSADVTENATFVRVNSISGNPLIHNAVTSPTVPRDLTRPNPGQPASTTIFTQTGTVTHQGLECPASGSVPVVVQPRTTTCADFPVTVTPGTPVTSQTNTTYTVNTIPITTSPNTAGTMVWTPSLPAVLNRPLFGQTASQVFNGVFSYTPATGLNCTATASKTVSIPAQTCETSYPPTWTVPTVTQGSTNLSATNSVGSTGEWELNIHATSSLTECNNHNYDHWYKGSEKVDLACGQGTTPLSVSYQWAGHPDEYWRVEVVKDGTRVWESSCIQNTHN